MIFYFSGTGNSEWVAKEVAKAQNETICFIPEVMQKKRILLSSLEKRKNRVRISHIFFGPA